VTFDTTVLLSFASLVVLNKILLFGKTWHYRNLIFWSLQLLNLCGATFFAGWGVRQFQETMPIVNWILSGLLVLRIIQNNRRYTRAWSKVKTNEPNLERRQEVLDKLTDE